MWFNPSGIGIMTSGILASIHYYNLPRHGIANNPDTDDKILAESTTNLSFNQQDNVFADWSNNK
jgi:hypothetical protein